MYAPTANPGSRLWLRFACFVASIPSGGVLLAKLYGLGPMDVWTLTVALPCCLALVFFWAWARRHGEETLAADLAIGALGGFIGSIGYDVFRIPFHIAGMHVFGPIRAFGVWVAGADMSSRWTDVIGWSYHYSNGVTFGIMYALVMRGRHWGWAVAWALLLETIAVVCPFGRVFSLRGNYPALAIAYAAHVPYGLLLGVMVWRSEAVLSWLSRVPRPLKIGVTVIAIAALVGPLLSPDEIARDRRALPGEFRVEENQLNPTYLRVHRSSEIAVVNPEDDAVTIVLKPHAHFTVAAGGKEMLAFPGPGVYQIFVDTGGRSRSSFVIVEPVEAQVGDTSASPRP